MKILTPVLIVCFTSTSTFAQIVQNPAIYPQVTVVQPTVQMVPVSVTNPGIVQAAEQQRNSSENSAKMNQMMGFMMIGMCALGIVSSMGGKPGGGQTQPGGQQPQQQGGGTNPLTAALPCIMGAIMLAQADKARQDAADAYRTQMMAATTTQYVPVYGSPQMPPNAMAGYQTLATAGYQVTPAVVTLPGGKMIPTSAFNSAQGLKQYGVSLASFEKVQKLQNQFQNEAKLQLASGTDPWLNPENKQQHSARVNPETVGGQIHPARTPASTAAPIPGANVTLHGDAVQ